MGMTGGSSSQGAPVTSTVGGDLGGSGAPLALLTPAQGSITEVPQAKEKLQSPAPEPHAPSSEGRPQTAYHLDIARHFYVTLALGGSDGHFPLSHTHKSGDSEPTEGLPLPRHPGLIHF